MSVIEDITRYGTLTEQNSIDNKVEGIVDEIIRNKRWQELFQNKVLSGDDAKKIISYGLKQNWSMNYGVLKEELDEEKKYIFLRIYNTEHNDGRHYKERQKIAAELRRYNKDKHVEADVNDIDESIMTLLMKGLSSATNVYEFCGALSEIDREYITRIRKFDAELEKKKKEEEQFKKLREERELQLNYVAY